MSARSERTTSGSALYQGLGLRRARRVRLRRVGIRIQPHGILAVYAVGHLRFPLETVAGFTTRPCGSSGDSRCVVIEFLNGERRVVPAASLASRRPVRNRDGRGVGDQMAEVVAQLNDQLRCARRQAAAALSDSRATAW